MDNLLNYLQMERIFLVIVWRQEVSGLWSPFASRTDASSYCACDGRQWLVATNTLVWCEYFHLWLKL